MKVYRLFQALVALILLACLSGVQGQYSAPTIGYPVAAPASGAAQSIASQSQFYQMLGGPAPSNHIGTPQPFVIAGNTPANVYFSSQVQPVPYIQYLSSPTYTETNSLWIKGTQDWTQYAIVPPSATVTLLAISPTEGSGNLNFVDSDGQSYTYNYYFYPYSQLTFYADIPGRHVLSFFVNGQLSNTVTIDVTGTTYTPPGNYLPPTYQYPWYYSGYPMYNNGYYPWYYGYNAPSTSPVANVNTNVAPSVTPSVTPNVTPSVAPSVTPSVAPSAPSIPKPIAESQIGPFSNPAQNTAFRNPGGAPSVTPVTPSVAPSAPPMPKPIAESQIGPFNNPAQNIAFHNTSGDPSVNDTSSINNTS
jgi:hypothetical protein